MRNVERVRSSIKESASDLFGRLGYEKTSIDQIAKLAHKAKASVYYHFDSKLSIYRSVMEDEFRALRENLEEVRERYAGKDAECMSKYLMARMEGMLKMPIYSNYMKDRIINQSYSEVAYMVNTIRKDFDEWEYRYFKSIGERGIKEGIFTDRVYPDMFAKMLENILKGLEIQFFVTDDRDAVRSTYEAMVEILIYRNPRLPENGRVTGQEERI